MFKVIFCQLNSKYSHTSLAPWCLLAGVKKYATSEINAFVIEGTVNESINVLFERITKDKPNVIGFCTYIWNVTIVKKLVHMIKGTLPDTVIVLGGPEVSYNAAEVLANQRDVDYVISGEGEEPIARLLDAINNGFAIPNVYGISYRLGEETVCAEPFISTEEPPSPYCEEYFAALGNRMPYLETSRGCPYSCDFCLSGRCGGVRFFNMERTKREIVTLAQSTSLTVKLVDRTFNANKSRSKEILRFISDNYGNAIPKGVCFHFEIAGDILDEETIEILNSMPKGSVQLEIGMQSFNEKTLEYVNRKTDTTKLKSNILKLTERKNIHIHIDLIAGLPFEDFNSFKDSFNVGYALNSDMLQMGFLKLLHGAEMRENAEKYPCEFSNEPPYEVISTPWLSKAEMNLLRNTEDALDRLHNSGRFKGTLQYVLAKSGLTAFNVFYGFGNFVADKKTDNVALDDYIGLVYEYFGNLDGIDTAVLRDKMVCDRFATNSFGMLPAALQIKEPALIHRAKKLLDASAATRQGVGVKRSIAILYSEANSNGEHCAVYADYKDSDKNRQGISAPEYAIHKFWFK